MKVFLTTNCLAINGWLETTYTVIDKITEPDVKFPIVVNCEEYGKDWVGFVKEDEIIEIDETETDYDYGLGDLD